MYEHGPLGPQFRFDLGDEVFEANLNNAAVYLHMHDEDSMFDHLFFLTEDDPEHPNKGYYAWRSGIDNFDEVVDAMRDCGFTVIENELVEKGDRAAYFASHEAELKTQELTMRQERFMNYWHYLLENNHVMPVDFQRSGELFI